MPIAPHPSLRPVVITHALRTPIGKYLGTLADFSAADLGTSVVGSLLRQSELDPSEVGQVIFGNGRQAGGGPNVARQIAVRAGCPEETTALTINMACASGLKSLSLAADRIALGQSDVVVAGVTPPARFWTLTLYDRKGHLVANSLQRYGFTSQEIVRQSDGSFEIRIASRSRAGNWLPTGGIERYALMLRLYDTPVGVATRTQRDAPMPSITTVGCS